MSEEVVWEDPPNGPGSSGCWGKLLAPLREHPGRWAKVKVGNDVVRAEGSNIKRGAYAGIEAGEFEVTSRAVGDGRYALYARYVGEVEA